MQFTPSKQPQARPEPQPQPGAAAEEPHADPESSRQIKEPATPPTKPRAAAGGNGGVAESVYGTAHMVAKCVALGVKTLQSSSFRRYRTRRRRPVEGDTPPSNVLFRWLFRACIGFQAFLWLRVRHHTSVARRIRVSPCHAAKHLVVNVLVSDLRISPRAVLIRSGDPRAAPYCNAGSDFPCCTGAGRDVCTPSAVSQLSRGQSRRRSRRVHAASGFRIQAGEENW